MSKKCPVCHTAFDDEEFCPIHFVALVSPATEPEPQTPAAMPEAQAEPAESATPAPPATPAAPGRMADNDAPPTPADAHPVGAEGLLERVAKRLGDRFKKKTPTPADADPARPQLHERTAQASIDLPAELREKGWVVSGPSVTQDGIDVWPVQHSNDGRVEPGEVCNGQLVVYASGVLTDPPTYERLLGLETAPTRAHLHAFGTIDRGHRVRASYELLTLPGQWQQLSAWLADSPPSEERALSLLPGLIALLADWSESGVFPISLDPSVLQRNAEGRLRLVRFGAMWSATADGTVYRPEFARSGLLPAPWAAPELKGRLVMAPQSVVFSMAQLLAAALFGQPPSLHDVQSGLIPFPSIQNQSLARILMGGLWPRVDSRWSLVQMLAGLEAIEIQQMPAAPAWSRLMPGAAETAFDLGGESFYRLEDLVTQANQPKHWDEAVQRMDELLLWASGTAWKGVAAGLRTELTTGTRSADWVLVRLTRQVRPDLPLTWRTLDFSDTHAQASLAALAQQALTSSPPDFSLLQQLMRADLRGAFTVPN